MEIHLNFLQAIGFNGFLLFLINLGIVEIYFLNGKTLNDSNGLYF